MIGPNIVTIHQHAGPFERFAPDAFVRQIGRTIPVCVQLDETGDAHNHTHGVVMDAEVIEGGRAVNITIELGPWN